MDWSKFFGIFEIDAGSDVMGQDSNALRYAKAERIFTASRKSGADSWQTRRN